MRALYGPGREERSELPYQQSPEEVYECFVNAVNGPDIFQIAAYRGALKDKTPNEILIKAAIGRSIKYVRVAIELGADINAVDLYGRTALILAANKGFIHIVKYLIALGADWTVVDHFNCTALEEACAQQHTEVMQYLLEVERISKLKPAPIKSKLNLDKLFDENT